MASIRIAAFDTWQSGYGQASVTVLRAGTATPATIYTDEALTVEADNPQVLIERIVDGASFGKFAQPLYVGVPFELEINSVDRTGVERPALTTLDGEDASAALVTVTGGSVAGTLADRLARSVDVRDFGAYIAVGEEGASAATNNATLAAALGAAGARGSGYVSVPSGTFQIVAITLPQGVVIRGVGRGATILQSTVAGEIATIGGDRAGFTRITLDGVSLVGNSIGVYARDRNQIVFDDVEIKRFETGVQLEGGTGCDWHELYVSNCVNGYRGIGLDFDTGTSELKFNSWHGGIIDTCSAKAIELKQDGVACTHNYFSGVGFDSNTAKSVSILGARAVFFDDCWWSGNGDDLTVNDGSPVTNDNTVIGVEITDSSIDGGTMSFTGNAEAIAFRRVTFQDVTVSLNSPSHSVLVEDCREISGVSIAAGSTAWNRNKTFDRGASSGLTTGNAPTKAWSIPLDAGQRVYLVATVVGRGRNTSNDGFFYFAVSARRPGASLNYDTQITNFTAGDIVTGGTSGATARIAGDSDSGATGTLTLQDIAGAFVDNEIITDGDTGQATVNGTLVFSDAVLVGSVTDIRAPQKIDGSWAATFVANGPEIEVHVTGNSAQTIEWEVDVDVTSS